MHHPFPHRNSYIEAHERIEKLYQDQDKWAKMCIMNIAGSGYFSSDRTIKEYIRDIWHLDKLEAK